MSGFNFGGGPGPFPNGFGGFGLGSGNSVGAPDHSGNSAGGPLGGPFNMGNNLSGGQQFHRHGPGPDGCTGGSYKTGNTTNHHVDGFGAAMGDLGGDLSGTNFRPR